jgi:tripartite-type tricarboxylate transporter receptor subunit TctC
MFAMKKMLHVILILTLIFSLAACASKESGNKEAAFPAKEVKMIVPFGAGGTVDLAARALTDGFQKETGQPLVVENQVGGAGVPATMNLVKGDKDGYTVAMLASGILSLRPVLQTVEFTFPDDFTPIIGVGDFQMVFAVKKDAPYENVKEMIAHFKGKNEAVRVGTAGVNSYSHLLAVLISKKSGMQIRHLPFDGNNGAVTAVLGGHADLAIVNLSNVTSQLDAGTMKVIGIPAAERYGNFKDAPTLKEQGIDVVGGTTFAIYGPAGMPQEEVKKLREIFLKAMDSEQFQKFVTNTNLLLTKTESDQLIEEIVQDRKNLEEVKKELE